MTIGMTRDVTVNDFIDIVTGITIGMTIHMITGITEDLT